MITLKIKVKQDDDNKMEVKLETPKDLSKSTDEEQALSKWIVEKINEMFEKKGN